MSVPAIFDAPTTENGYRTSGGPVTPEAARRIVLENIDVVSGTETVPLHAAVGRIAAEDLLSAVALPGFDNAAVDGFGIHADDHNLPIPLTLSIVERVPAGANINVLSRSGTALRILTGAKVPAGIGSVVFERRTTRRGNKITLNELPESGANIRRRGEDVTPGTIVVSKGTTLDARQIAILAAAGITRTPVTRRLRVGILSRCSELVDALLASPSIETIDLRVADTQTAISAALRDGAKHLDLLIMSAGITGNNRDRLEPPFRAAGGICQSLKLALRPGKPLAKGRIGRMHVLALPENPVAAFVNYLLFGRPMIRRLLGATDAGRAMSYARVAEAFRHKAGRTEIVPACIVGHGLDGLPRIRKLDRGGSARLLPLVVADGFAEIGPGIGDVPPDGLLRFHPFVTSFTL
jgi:molybdopterin molybdotransferase